MKWIGGLAEWQYGSTTYLSIAFTWKVPEAHSRARFARACGQRVIAGGPAMMLEEMRDVMESVAEVPTKQVFTRGKMRTVGADYPDGPVVHMHNPMATLASRGCSKDCYFCNVPVVDGPLVELPDFPVRPILCDNNLSALDPAYQDYIIGRYREAGVKMIDANSGFEPDTFSDDVYNRWKALVNAGGGPWRFGYDTTSEAKECRRVMRMLAGEPQKRKRMYVLIGNEPFDKCMARIHDVLDNGCEPHCQPFLALNAMEREPHDRLDWTGQKMKDVARWANRRGWKYGPFETYDRYYRSNAPAEVYDEQQGLFT